MFIVDHRQLILNFSLSVLQHPCVIGFLERNGQRTVKENNCVRVTVVGKRQLGGMPGSPYLDKLLSESVRLSTIIPYKVDNQTY